MIRKEGGYCFLSRVGFTTSIPIEVLLAAGKTPVDINNRFVSREDALALVRNAEDKGFPPTCCAWVKGIYSTLQTLDLEEVIGVVRGDCSQTQALMEILQMEGMRVYPFAYPYDRSFTAMQEEMNKLQEHFGASEGHVQEVKRDLDRIRGKLNHLDVLTWKENRVTGEENHSFLISSSDMRGNPSVFEKEIDSFLEEAGQRAPFGPEGEIRLGFLGVPPIWDDLYQRIEKKGVRVVYNEVQRQFSMPALEPELVRQYLLFTYPYDIFYRLEDVERERNLRDIDGFIHYVQSFCFRQIEDKIFRHYLSLPILTLEGDRPEPLDARTEVRLEAFFEMLARNKGLKRGRMRKN